jgi:hypothetical protein
MICHLKRTANATALITPATTTPKGVRLLIFQLCIFGRLDQGPPTSGYVTLSVAAMIQRFTHVVL